MCKCSERSLQVVEIKIMFRWISLSDWNSIINYWQVYCGWDSVLRFWSDIFLKWLEWFLSKMAYLMRFSDFSVFWFSSVGSICSTSITGYRLFSEMNGMAFRAGLTLSDLFCFLIGFGGVLSEREDIIADVQIHMKYWHILKYGLVWWVCRSLQVVEKLGFHFFDIFLCRSSLNNMFR